MGGAAALSLAALTAGAWWALGAPDAPTEAKPAGLIQALPAAQGGEGAQHGPHGSAGQAGQAGQGAGPTAAQVLQEAALRGRQASAVAGPGAARPAPAALSADALQAQVRQDAAAVQRQSMGQRLRVQGTLASVEPGEPGVLVLHLALAEQAGTVRVVAAPDLVPSAAQWVAPRAVSLDCLSQGVMMGEWLLVDCRL